jgi:DNA invertase Pin-like site-specific DNA recombinase
VKKTASPKLAAIYLRVSLDATGEQLAVSRQREDCERIAAERGWTVRAEYADNSVGASDKRKDRPAYDRMVKAFAAGEFDALICYDLDRLTRQPRQLEDWIDAAEERGLVLVTANGEADLSTDAGRLFARIKASVARAEVERKSARQTRAALQRSEAGRPPKGVRLTGYETDGTVIESEAVTIREVFNRFHRGDSLKGITKWLTETSVPTRSGRPWNPSSVRSILTNPRYAGRAIYQGQPIGRPGTWQPIVDGAVYDVVQATISDPRRRSQIGTDRKYLGSGLYLCQVCRALVRSHSGGRYRCPSHLTRIAASIDEFVLMVLRERLARPDLADVLRAPDGEKAQALASEIGDLRARLVVVEADYDAGLITGLRFRAATDKIQSRLVRAEAAQLRMMTTSGVAGLLTAPDPVAAFNAAPLGIQRAVLAFFMTVVLAPAQRGYKFNPDDGSVVFEWRSS